MSEELITPMGGKAAKRTPAPAADPVTEAAAVMAAPLEETPHIPAPEPEAPAAVEILVEAATETVEAAVEPVMEAVVEVVEEATPEPVSAPAASSSGSAFKVFELVTPNPALVEQSAKSLLAFAGAGEALAKGAQDASRTWLEAAKTGAALQREGLKQIALARDVTSLIEAYSDLARRNVETFADCAQTMTRMSLQTAETARKMLRAAA